MKKLLWVFLFALSTQLLYPQQPDPKTEEEELEAILNDLQAGYDTPKSTSVVAFVFYLFLGVGYFVLCGVAAVAGNNRTITAGWAFLISLFLTPIVGIICVALSEKNDEIIFRRKLLVMISDFHKASFPEAYNKSTEKSGIKEMSAKERKEQKWREEIAQGKRSDPSL